MADNKKYYWLKLKTDFFNQREIKKLRKIAGGDTYTIIYLKLQLLSTKTDGVIKYDGTEKDIIEQLELELDEDRDNISVTLSFLEANGLLEQISDTNYLMPKVCESIGKEGSSAERVRKHRQQKALQCNTKETKCNTEIEKRDREKRKEINKEDKLLSYVDDILLPDLNLQAFKEWLEFKKYKYQKVGISKLVNMLAKYSYQEQQQIVDNSIMNNYQGLFELKNKPIKIKVNAIVPKELIGETFLYDGVNITFNKDGYWNGKWNVTKFEDVECAIKSYNDKCINGINFDMSNIKVN